MANRKQAREAAIAENVRPLDSTPEEKSAKPAGMGKTAAQVAEERKAADLKAANEYRDKVKAAGKTPTAGRPSAEGREEKAHPALSTAQRAKLKLDLVLGRTKSAKLPKTVYYGEHETIPVEDPGPRYGNPHKKSGRR